MVTQNHQIISSRELRKNGGKISRLWNQEIQELKENSENQNTKKSTSTWLNVWTSWAENKNFKTNLLAYEAKQHDENKHMALDDRISQVVAEYKQVIAWIVRDMWHKYHSWYFKIAPNFTRLTAREIMWNNFEISLVVFMPNITTNRAITYTYRSSCRDVSIHSVKPFYSYFITAEKVHILDQDKVFPFALCWSIVAMKSHFQTISELSPFSFSKSTKHSQ